MRPDPEFSGFRKVGQALRKPRCKEVAALFLVGGGVGGCIAQRYHIYFSPSSLGSQHFSEDRGKIMDVADVNQRALVGGELTVA